MNMHYDNIIITISRFLAQFINNDNTAYSNRQYFMTTSPFLHPAADNILILLYVLRYP